SATGSRASTTSTRRSAGSHSPCSWTAPRRATTVSSRARQTECCHRSKPLLGVAEIAAVLVAARDEESDIARTVGSLRAAFPDAEVIVADDGSRDETAAAAQRAGARVLRLPARGKGQALTVAERAAPAGFRAAAATRPPRHRSRRRRLRAPGPAAARRLARLRPDGCQSPRPAAAAHRLARGTAARPCGRGGGGNRARRRSLERGRAGL